MIGFENTFFFWCALKASCETSQESNNAKTLFVHVTPTRMCSKPRSQALALAREKYQFWVIKVSNVVGNCRSRNVFSVPADNSLRLITEKKKRFRHKRGLNSDCRAISHRNLHVSHGFAAIRWRNGEIKNFPCRPATWGSMILKNRKQFRSIFNGELINFLRNPIPFALLFCLDMRRFRRSLSIHWHCVWLRSFGDCARKCGNQKWMIGRWRKIKAR